MVKHIKWSQRVEWTLFKHLKEYSCCFQRTRYSCIYANTTPRTIGVICLVWEQGFQLRKRSHDWTKMPDLISWWVVKTSKNMFPSLWWIKYQRILHFLQKSHHSAKPTLSPETRHPRRWRWGPFYPVSAGVKGTSPSRDIPADESSNELIAKPGSGNGGLSWGSAAVKLCIGDSPSNKLNHQDSAIFSIYCYLLRWIIPPDCSRFSQIPIKLKRLMSQPLSKLPGVGHLNSLWFASDLSRWCFFPWGTNTFVSSWCFCFCWCCCCCCCCRCCGGGGCCCCWLWWWCWYWCCCWLRWCFWSCFGDGASAAGAFLGGAASGSSSHTSQAQPDRTAGGC